MESYIKSQAGGVAPARMIQLGAGLKMTAQADSTLLEVDGGAIVLTSPNGTKYTLAVADDGTIGAVEAAG